MGLTIDLSSPGGLVVALLPELVLTGWALVILLAVAWRHRDAADQQLAGQLSSTRAGQHTPSRTVALDQGRSF